MPRFALIGQRQSRRANRSITRFVDVRPSNARQVQPRRKVPPLIVRAQPSLAAVAELDQIPCERFEMHINDRRVAYSNDRALVLKEADKSADLA